MQRLACRQVPRLPILPAAPLLLAALAITPALGADALSAVQVLRAGGCGGVVPIAPPLEHSAALDRAAQQWAHGTSLGAAAERNGYGALPTTGVYVRGADGALLEQLRRANCAQLTDRTLRAVGVYRSGTESWLVLAPWYSPSRPTAAAGTAAPVNAPATFSRASALPAAPAAAVSAPPPPSGAALASRALQLVNDVRARGTRCGARSFGPAPPVSLSGTLAGVALGHASDMAEHDYFEHQDLAGESPADRVRAVGYREKLVGENIAYGPGSVDEAVRGWLDSPGHCENIMDPRFAEMGIAFAAGRTTRRGLYWVQVLAEPRA